MSKILVPSTGPNACDTSATCWVWRTVHQKFRYQLLHRIASAVIEAERFDARLAGMIVHSFSTRATWFDEFSSFVRLLGVSSDVEPGRSVVIGAIGPFPPAGLGAGCAGVSSIVTLKRVAPAKSPRVWPTSIDFAKLYKMLSLGR